MSLGHRSGRHEAARKRRRQRQMLRITGAIVGVVVLDFAAMPNFDGGEMEPIRPLPMCLNRAVKPPGPSIHTRGDHAWLSTGPSTSKDRSPMDMRLRRHSDSRTLVTSR